MFGFQGGKSADTVARKKGYMMLNKSGVSIKTEGQLCSVIKTRSGILEEQAKRDVDAWMQGKQF